MRKIIMKNMFEFIAKVVFFPSAFLSMFLCSQASAADVQKIVLKNEKIKVEITPDIGGRLLSIALQNKANFLQLGEPVVSNPNPAVNAEAENIGYLGHEIWAGPQSEWWIHQSLNSKRAAEKSVWPPDPYLALAKNTVVKKSAEKLILLNPASPITGLELTKTYSLIKNKKNSLQLDVIAKNIRSENVAWDIWFNSRVHANTQVYVPVADISDVHVKNMEDETYGPLKFSLTNGVFALDVSPVLDAGGITQKSARKGKIMLQPSQGWMAGFYDDQVLIIQFAHQEKSKIHPEQGQVELYSDYLPDDLGKGLLEMEVHAPYKNLAPSDTMSAQEVWTILEYKGSSSPSEQLGFLRKHAAEIGIVF